jgi:tetratricopeptide (TPR) repeat protein
VNRLAFSADAKRVVTAGADGTARVWDAATGEPVSDWLRHGAAVAQAAFSPDGKRVATASADRTARVWDADSGKPLGPPLRHRALVALAAFSADGRWLLTAAGNRVRLWDAATGEPISPPLRHGPEDQAISFAALEPGGRLVTAVGTPGDPAGRWERTLRSDGRPLEDLEKLAEVLAGRRTEAGGESIPLESRDLASAWQTLRQKYAADFTPGEERVRAWEVRGARECETRGLAQGAADHLGRLIESSTAPGDLYARRARAHAELRQWEKAQADYGKALEAEPDRWDLWAGRARAAAGLGRWEQAAADYTKALERRGNDPDLWLGRGQAEAERGQWAKAAADLGKAVALGRHEPEVRFQSALALLAAGDVEGYRRACARLLQRADGSDAPARRLLARACTLAPDSGADLQALLRQAEQAVEADPRSAADRGLLGALLYRTGKFGPAVRHLEEAIRLSADKVDPLDQLFLAMAQQRLGHAADARKALDSATEKVKGPAGGASIPWPERLEYELVWREAEALLKGSKP